MSENVVSKRRIYVRTEKSDMYFFRHECRKRKQICRDSRRSGGGGTGKRVSSPCTFMVRRTQERHIYCWTSAGSDSQGQAGRDRRGGYAACHAAWLRPDNGYELTK